MPKTAFGAFGYLLLVKQAALGTPVVAGMIGARHTSRSNFNPEILFADTEAGHGLLAPTAGEVTGRRLNGASVDFEPTVPVLQLVSEHILGAVAATNIITPNMSNDFAANCPLVPLTLQNVAPGEEYQIADAQIGGLEINYAPNKYFGAKLTDIKGLTITDLGSPAAYTVPANPFASNHGSLTVGGSAVVPETFSMKLQSGIKFIDGMNGSTAAAGFARDDGSEGMGFRTVTFDFTVNGVWAALKAAYEAGTTTTAQFSLVRSSNIWRMEMLAAQVRAREIPLPNGRVMTRVQLKAVYNGSTSDVRVLLT